MTTPFYSLGDKRSSGRVQERLARERSLLIEQERQRVACLPSDTTENDNKVIEDGLGLSEREQRRLLRDQKRALEIAKEAEQQDKEEQVEQIARSMAQMPLKLFLRVPATGNEEIDIINNDKADETKHVDAWEQMSFNVKEEAATENPQIEEAALLIEFAQETNGVYPPCLADSTLSPLSKSNDDQVATSYTPTITETETETKENK